MAGTLSKSKGRDRSRKKARNSPNPDPEPLSNPGPAVSLAEPPISQVQTTKATNAPGEPDLKTRVREPAPTQSSAAATRQATGIRSFAEATENETQVVTFQLAREEYAIDILQVQEIVMMTRITRMPKAPHFIEGIVNLRGQMIPIIDMRKRFSLAEAEHDSDTRIIIVDIGETVGMVVDGVRDVIRLPDSAISPPPPMIQGISAEYLKGIGQFDDRLLIMLDLEKVLTAEEQEVLQKLGPDGCPLTKE